MILPARLTAALARGAAYLAKEQQADGSFQSFVSSSRDPFEGRPAAPTTFLAALILGAVQIVGQVGSLRAVRANLADFLLRQRSTAWTFNYWPRDSPEAGSRPYPDDLDDTFCALLALQQDRPELVGAEVMAAAVRQLTYCESEVGGPYVTWILPSTAEWPRAVDLGVNCNVGAFLARQGVKLPRLAALVEQAIASGTYTTPYYDASPYPVMYFIARFYRGPEVPQLRADLWSRREGQEGGWGNALDTALAVLAALEMGAPAADLTGAVEQLLAMEVAGAWPAAALYVEQRAGAKVQYAGAATLTTALAMEALARYGMSMAVPEAEPEAKAIQRAVVLAVRQQLLALPGMLGRLGPQLLAELVMRDTHHEIVLLPYHFERALRLSLNRATRAEVLSLGMANVYGWLAYTAYDDVLDGDGRPEWLPVANAALRQLMLKFEAMATVNPAIPVLARRILDQVDEANAWEMVRARGRIERDRLIVEALPDYGDLAVLANRSFGHALGPLSLLLIRGFNLESVAVQQTMIFFRHYLIARQLNDDVHDWEQDLGRGQLNIVGTRLLRGLGPIPAEGWLLAEILPGLRQRLWQEDIEAICAEVLVRVEQAQAALRANPELRDASWLDGLVLSLAEAARRAVRERSEAQVFLAAYRGDSPPKP